MEDAKGLLRAGLDAFAHGVRDKDMTMRRCPCSRRVLMLPSHPIFRTAA
jgi:hypothetical protein